MNLLIDANVLLDVLLDRKPFAEDSNLVWRVCEAGLVDGYVSTLSFANIAYMMRKKLKKEQIQNLLIQMSSIFTFVDLTFLDLKRAADLKWKDYEDAIQYVTAKKVHADGIVTRNIKDFEDSQIFVSSPQEILKILRV